MRKLIIIIIVLAIAALGYLAYAQFSGGAVPTFGLPIGGEKAKVRKRTLAFFEHVKFKNTSALSDFVASGTDPDEIFHYLTKSFGINVNNIDLMDVSIEEIQLNSSETRARVLVKIKFQDIRERNPKSVEKILFLYLSPDGKWLMDIKNLVP